MPDSDDPRPTTAAKAVGRGLGRIARATLYWIPVWASLVILAQVSLRGLRPALAESRRLEACEQRLGARCERDEQRRAELEALHQALTDPIYVERLRLARR